MTEKPQNSRQFLVTPSSQNGKQPKHKHRDSEMVPNEKNTSLYHYLNRVNTEKCLQIA